MVEIAGDGVSALFASGKKAVFLSFAELDPDESFGEVDVAELETAEFGAANARSVEKLEERAVPKRAWALLEEAFDIALGKRFRKRRETRH